MGEAKRRKILDPLFGKVRHRKTTNKKSRQPNIDDYINEGVALFPMGMLNAYYRFTGIEHEYSYLGGILEGFSDYIQHHVHVVFKGDARYSFIQFLHFFRNNRVFFNKYVSQATKDQGISPDEALIYLWKRLAVAAEISSQFALLDDLDEDDPQYEKIYHETEIEEWDKFRDLDEIGKATLREELKADPEAFHWKYSILSYH